MARTIADTARAIAVVAIMALMVVLVLSSVSGVAKDDRTTVRTNIEGGSGTIPTTGLLTVDNITRVQQSLGTGARLDGTNSYDATGVAELQPPFELTVYTELDTGVPNTTRAITTYDTAPGQLVLTHNATAGAYEVFYYNASARNSYSTVVAAPSPTAPTVLSVAHSGDTLTLYRNGTAGTAVSTTGQNIAAVDDNVSNWVGTQDELRVFNGTLTAAQRADIVSVPTRGIANNADTRMRVMFDKATDGTVPSL